MHNPEFLRENEMHKIIWDFEIQTDNIIPARRPDLVIIKKKGICRPVKIKENEKRDMYLDLAREVK